MFAGIVEAKTELLEYTAPDPKTALPTRIKIKKPNDFNDLSIGDSISVNGVCLTVEAFDEAHMQFALGAETLKVTGWNSTNLGTRPLNLERSLRLQDRVHGHFVSGHVDGVGTVLRLSDEKGSRILVVAVEARLHQYLWPKGSVALNGVSLTINAVARGELEVCLVPETLKRTNFSDLLEGDQVTIEVDPFARGMAHYFVEFERRPREFHN
jgi:riboflavin synthase